MKKTLFVLMLSLVTMFGMAQGHPGGPKGHDKGHGRGPAKEFPHEMRQAPCATPEQMQLVLKVLNNQSFDDKKLEIGKLCVVLGHFCTRDLALIAEQFSFDDNRKQFLIDAYPYCVDPENYYSLKEVFQFRSNFDEMMEKTHPGYSR